MWRTGAFGTRVERLLTDGDTVTGVATATGDIYRGAVILATGIRPAMSMSRLPPRASSLRPRGSPSVCAWSILQQLVDRLQYHSPQGRGRWLPAASIRCSPVSTGVRYTLSACVPVDSSSPAASETGPACGQRHVALVARHPLGQPW